MSSSSPGHLQAPQSTLPMEYTVSQSAQSQHSVVIQYYSTPEHSCPILDHNQWRNCKLCDSRNSPRLPLTKGCRPVAIGEWSSSSPKNSIRSGGCIDAWGNCTQCLHVDLIPHYWHEHDPPSSSSKNRHKTLPHFLCSSASVRPRGGGQFIFIWNRVCNVLGPLEICNDKINMNVHTISRSVGPPLLRALRHSIGHLLDASFDDFYMQILLPNSNILIYSNP